MDVQSNSINDAVASLLAPQKEQGEEDKPEETLESEETEAQETDTEEVDQEESEDQDEENTEYEFDDEEQEESDDESSDEESDRYTVKVDGEEYEVNLQELIKGYQLEKNFTKKNQQLSEEKKELAALKSELTAQRDQYLARLEEIASQTNSELERAKQQLSQIDREEDPIGYLTKQSEVQDIYQNLQVKAQQYQQAQQEQHKQHQEHMQQFLAQQREVLASALPELNDPEQGPKVQEAITSFAVDTGYTPEEIQRIVDARDVIVLNKARLYDEMQKKKAVVAKKRAPGKPSAKIAPGTSKSNNTKRARLVKDKRDRLKSTGSAKDAAALMVELMQSRSVRK